MDKIFFTERRKLSPGWVVWSSGSPSMQCYHLRWEGHVLRHLLCSWECLVWLIYAYTSSRTTPVTRSFKLQKRAQCHQKHQRKSFKEIVSGLGIRWSFEKFSISLVPSHKPSPGFLSSIDKWMTLFFSKRCWRNEKCAAPNFFFFFGSELFNFRKWCLF